MLTKRIHQYLPLATFLITATILLYWGLGARSLWESEDRWAEITRNMLNTGDFFHPIINANIYFDKPLLSYWFIAAIATIFGNLSEWAARVPSAIAGMLALYATFYLGRELWSKKVAWVASWILLTSYGFLFWSRTASADMTNMTAVIAAVSWFFANKNKKLFLNYFVFYFICVIGAQTKGLTAIVIPVLVIFPYICREKRWQFHFNLPHLAAIILAALLYFLPFVIALKAPLANGYHVPDTQLNGLNLVYRENILRFFKPFDHQGDFFTYFYSLPSILFPWSPLFYIAFYVNATRIKKVMGSSRWLIEAITLIFIFFTISGSRRWYYILPITPFCALLMAEFLIDTNKEILKKYSLLLIKSILVIINVLFFASPLLWKFAYHYEFTPPLALIYSTFGVGCLGCFCFIIDRWKPMLLSGFIDADRHYAVIIVASVILLGGWICVQQPSFESLRTGRDFSEQLKKIAIVSENIAFYDHIPPSIAYYLNFDKPILILKENNLISAIKNNDKLIIVTEKNRSVALKKALSCQYQMNPLIEETDFPWENNEKNKKLIALKMTEFKNIHEMCKIPTDLSKPTHPVSPHEYDDFN